MADLTTLAIVKEWLRETGSANDALIQRMLSAASGFVEEYCGRTLTEAAYDEYLDGNGKGSIYVVNYPISVVTSVTINGTIIPPIALGQHYGTGWMFQPRKNGRIDLLNKFFEEGVNNIRVVYTAGYNPVPQSIQQVVCEIVGVHYREQDRIGLVSKSLAGETIAFTQKDMSASNKLALAPYKRVFMP